MNRFFQKALTLALTVLLIFPLVPSAFAAQTGDYIYRFSETAPEKTLLTHLENRDAVDAWSMTYIQNLSQTQSTPLALKPDFTPPRTHMTFEFEVATDGKYELAVYHNPNSVNTSHERRICIEIDDMGKQDIPCVPDTKVNMYLIISLELLAGKHSFTVYAPMEFGQKTTDGKTVNSANLISYDIYAQPEVIEAKGYQTAADGEHISLRIVYGVESLAWSRLGMEIDTAGETSLQTSVETTAVYSSVLANKEDGSGTETVTAASQNAKALAVLVCKLKNEGVYTLTVKPFLIDHGGVKHYGKTVTIAVEDGACAQVLTRVDESMAAMHYGLRMEGKALTLVCGGTFSQRVVFEQLIPLLETDEDIIGAQTDSGYIKTGTLLNNPDGLARADGADLRIVSCNAMANGFDPAFAGFSDTGDYTFEMRTEIFEALLEVYAPDVMGLQEVCPSWYRYFDAVTLTDGKWAIAKGDTSGERTYFLQPILYRADKLTLVAEGWEAHSYSDLQAWGGRYLSWAVFEVKSSGERFAVVNAHWDGWSKPEKNAVQVTETLALIKKLQSDYTCKVLSTGDFNTPDINQGNMSIQDYTAFLQDGTLKDAKYDADRLVADIGSVHGWGPETYPRVYSFDHIFCTADTHILQFCTAWDNYQAYASDHAWLIADIDLSKTGPA